MRAASEELLGATIAARYVQGLMVFVHAPDREPADPEWEQFIELCKQKINVTGSLAILVRANEAPPTASQRSAFTRELANVPVRIAVLDVKPMLIPVIKVFSWFTGIKGFDRHAVPEALAFLESRVDPGKAEAALRELEGDFQARSAR